MTGPILIPLRCPGCGQTLEGGAQAIVFVCRTCGKAVCMDAPESAFPFRVASVRAEVRGPGVLAPFWRTRGRAAWHTEDGAKERIYSGMKPLGPLYFPAFWSPRAAYYDNMTMRYALDPPLDADGTAEGTLLDGVRGPSALPELARLTWLAYLDRAADVTGTELTYELQGLEYVAVPFFQQDDFVVEGHLGLRLPAAFLAG